MENLNNNKKFLQQYGKLTNYDDFNEQNIPLQYPNGLPYRLITLIKESEVGNFTNDIYNHCGNIKLTDSTHYGVLSVELKHKDKDYLEVALCVENHHFIPDKILKEDILFFFETPKFSRPFIIVKDEYVKHFLESEHSVVGIVDCCTGKELLFQKDIKAKMKCFHYKINDLVKKYPDILCITISDSIIVKHSFQILNKYNLLLYESFNFNKIITLFKEIRETTKKILGTSIYGVFCYGKNQCEIIKPNSTNIFHTGIFSHAFEKVFEIEKICRRLKKDKQGDLYIEDKLYHSYRYYANKNRYNFSKSLSSAEWGLSKEDIDINKPVKKIDISEITALKIPDKPIEIPNKLIEYKNI